MVAVSVENCRHSTSLKYRIDLGHLRAAALWQFGGYTMSTQVNGGLANGYLQRNNIATTAGLRFRF
jgi:hypothetical protein